MEVSPPRRRRARPVVDVPADNPLLRGEQLAKGWLLALLEDAPLSDASSIAGGGVARDGPRLCEAVVRALASDDQLRRFSPGGELEPLCRLAVLAGGPDHVSRSVDALRAVLWSALLSALRDPEPELVAALSERLAVVTELVRGAALRSSGGGEALAWPAVLDREIARAEQDGASLALLLVELDEVERLVALEPIDRRRAIFARFADAVAGAIRRHDLLAWESEYRAWIIAPQTDRAAATALASAVAAAVRAGDGWRGAPLTVSAGIAALGTDGSDRAELIEAAEEARFAAAAEGITVVRRPHGQPG